MVAPHELRDQAEDLVLGPWLEDRVAADAPTRRRRCWIQVQGPDDLAKLLHHVIALDEEIGGQLQATQETGIPGQEDAALATGLGEKVVVLTGGILDIIPQNAQPPGQPAEHRIGQEPRGLSASGGWPRTCVHARTLTHSLAICKGRADSVHAHHG